MSVGRVSSIDVGTTNMGVCVVEKAAPVVHSADDAMEDPVLDATCVTTSAEASAVGTQYRIDNEAAAEAVIEAARYPYVIRFWDLIDLRTQSTKAATSTMVREFMSRPAMYEGVTDVAIESQAMSRTIMQCIECSIRTHFETYSMLQPAGAQPLRVHSVSGSNKLKIFTGDVEDIQHKMAVRARKQLANLPKRKMSESDRRHQKNKLLGILHMCGILEHNHEDHFLEWLDQQKKIDDLADAFLQACWILMNPQLYSNRAAATPLH